MSIYSHTFSGNVAGHSIHKSILFWSVKIQKEVRVNLINQFHWDILCSFSSGTAEVDMVFTAPLSYQVNIVVHWGIRSTFKLSVVHLGGKPQRLLCLITIFVTSHYCSFVATEIFTFLTVGYPSQLQPSVPTALTLSHWLRTIDPSVPDP